MYQGVGSLAESFSAVPMNMPNWKKQSQDPRVEMCACGSTV